MRNPGSVLRVNTVEETASYRSAVAEILRRVQNASSDTLLEISEKIDVSLGTVSNAANKKCDLNPIYLKRIGTVYGVHMLDPYAALMGGRLVALDADDANDVLPIINMAAYRIAAARSPASPGGTRETLQEKSAYLPDLLKLQRDLGALICTIEKELAA